jgi:hypothetical protein
MLFLFSLHTAHLLSKPDEIPNLESKKKRWLIEGEMPGMTMLGKNEVFV